MEDVHIPSNSDGECSVSPISALNYGHFPVQIRAGAVEDLVGVTVGTGIVVGVRVRVGV